MKEQMFDISTGEFVEIKIYPMDRIERDYFESQEEKNGRWWSFRYWKSKKEWS